MFVAGEVIDDGRLQQPVVEMAATAERAEPALGVSEIADRGLCSGNLVLLRRGVTLLLLITGQIGGLFRCRQSKIDFL
jgi:hypothetical protein